MTCGVINDFSLALAASSLQHMLMVTQMDSLTYAVYRPGMRLLTLEISRNESYIKRLRKKEKEFVEELAENGHDVQFRFVGRLVK